MSKRTLKKRFYPKNSNSIWIERIVISVEEIKLFASGLYKTVFKCKSETKKEGGTYVYWSYKLTDIKEGDVLQINGFLKDEVFIVKNLIRIQSSNQV